MREAPASGAPAGIAWILGAALSFSLMSLLMKVVATELPATVVAFFRLLFSLGIALPWIWRLGVGGLRTRRIGEHALMAALGVASLICFLIALAHLPLADVMALTFASPLWAILLSVFLLGEPVRVRRWTATAVGFVGVLLVIKPTGIKDPAILAALASGVFAALSVTVTKRLTGTDSALQVSVYYSLLGGLMTAPVATLEWQTPSLAQFAWLLAIGATGFLGQICHARALGAADLTVVAPMDYLRPPLAALLAGAFLGEVPDAWTVIGIIVIAGASGYIARREAVLRRPAAPPRGG